MSYLLLSEIQYSFLALMLLSIFAWFEIKILRKFFITKRIVSQVIHVASIHKRPVPYGGGIALIDMLVLALIFWLFFIESKVSVPTILGYEFLLALIGICLVSFWDDIKPLSPLPRLLVQMAFVALLLPLLPNSILLNYFPQWFDWLFAFLFWVCFTNFFNFMDGIDGISGVEMGSVGAGLFLVTLFIGEQDIFLTTGLPGLALLCAAIVFLWWNWHPAKIFLGDCGFGADWLHHCGSYFAAFQLWLLGSSSDFTTLLLHGCRAYLVKTNDSFRENLVATCLAFLSHGTYFGLSA